MGHHVQDSQKGNWVYVCLSIDKIGVFAERELWI